MTFSFFAFGCWNKGACVGNKDLATVINNIRTEKYDMGIILGDNIYKTSKSEKTYSIEILEAGIECLKSINKPMFIALGNHDIEECGILQKQLKTHVGELNREIDRDKFDWFLPHNYYASLIEDGGIRIKLIVLDTNLFVHEPINPENNPLKMYNQNECDTDNRMVSTGGYNIMLEFLKRELEEKVDKVIIVGHEPLVSFKPKKENILQKQGKIIVEKIMNYIAESPNSDRTIYVCADTHNHQHNVIKDLKTGFELHEYVFGTGGADPDVLGYFKIGRKEKFYENYELELVDYQPAYGFGEILVDKNGGFRVRYVKN